VEIIGNDAAAILPSGAGAQDAAAAADFAVGFAEEPISIDGDAYDSCGEEIGEPARETKYGARPRSLPYWSHASTRTRFAESIDSPSSTL
jgi:hypothetical protein